MHESFIGKRIAELLVVKQLSAEQVSEDLGQLKVYIDKIIANDILPSMNMFFAICNRLEISPVEFFTE
jgi:transcriptional regulator with XRE-family HTH domain